MAATDCQNGGLVDQVGQIRARESRCRAGECLELDLGLNGFALGVHPEDGRPLANIRVRQCHLSIEATWPKQGGVEHVGPIGGGDHDDVLVALEAVHLDQDLIERLFTLVVRATAMTGAALAADGVDLVDEDDAGRLALGLLEQVAHATGADTHEHLDKFGARDAEERHTRLAGHGAADECLTRARRPDQQHAFGDACAHGRELLG